MLTSSPLTAPVARDVEAALVICCIASPMSEGAEHHLYLSIVQLVVGQQIYLCGNACC